MSRDARHTMLRRPAADELTIGERFPPSGGLGPGWESVLADSPESSNEFDSELAGPRRPKNGLPPPGLSASLSLRDGGARMSDYQGEQYRTPYQPTFEQPQTYGVTPYQPVAVPSYVNPSGRPLVSAGGRFGAALLDGLLMVVTLWIGWIIWAMFTWSTGQTPAKQLLGHVVADAETGVPFDWGKMALREFCIKGLLGTLLNSCSFGIYFLVDSLMIFNERQQTLHDRMANSIVRHV